MAPHSFFNPKYLFHILIVQEPQLSGNIMHALSPKFSADARIKLKQQIF